MLRALTRLHRPVVAMSRPSAHASLQSQAQVRTVPCPLVAACPLELHARHVTRRLTRVTFPRRHPSNPSLSPAAASAMHHVIHQAALLTPYHHSATPYPPLPLVYCQRPGLVGFRAFCSEKGSKKVRRARLIVCNDGDQHLHCTIHLHTQRVWRSSAAFEALPRLRALQALCHPSAYCWTRVSDSPPSLLRPSLLYLTPSSLRLPRRNGASPHGPTPHTASVST